MGLFFNYDKPGPGVDKDAPKKKGIFLYFELFFRKFWLLIKANMLYFIVSLPVIAIYNFIIINIITQMLPGNMQDASWHMSLVFTAILVILWGTGPAMGGYIYLLRNFAREEHAWIVSDFFEKAKETFKTGIAVLIMDIAFLIIGINSANIYLALIRQGMVFAKFAFGVLIVIFFFYTFMHYYVYEFVVTFENKTSSTIKNAIITGIATLPANLFFTVMVSVFTVAAFEYITPFFIIILLFVMWISLMRFPIDFYASRMIKRKFIDGRQEESGE